MSSEARSSCYSNVTGHAHPTSNDVRDIETVDLQDLSNLIYKVPLDIVLSGLANEHSSPALAPIIPSVRRSPLTSGAVQHLDIVSCWKNLSSSQTTELTMWEGLFKECLASQIKQHLQHSFAKRLKEYPEPMTETLLVSRMSKFLMHKQPILVNISMTCLVHDMISLLYDSHLSGTSPCRFQWSISSSSLPNFVYNFVRTKDCFLYTAGGPCILLELTPCYTNGILAVFAKLHWQLPKITFSALPTRLSYNEMYRITPRPTHDTLGAAEYSGFSPLSEDIAYSITKSPLPLQWDYIQACFHAPVLHNDGINSEVLETILSVQTVTSLHADVRFERVSRYAIKLEVHEDAHATTGRFNYKPFRDNFDGKVLQDDDVCWIDPHVSELHTASRHIRVDSVHEGSSPEVPFRTSTTKAKTGHPYPQVHCCSHTDHCCWEESIASLVDHYDLLTRKDLEATSTRNSLPGIEEPLLSAGDKPVSPVKRKAWQCTGSTINTGGPFALDKVQHHDLEFGAKRRKTIKRDCVEINMEEDAGDNSQDDSSDDALHAHLERINTGSMGEAQSVSSSEPSFWNTKPGSVPDRSAQRLKANSSLSLKTHAAALASNKQTMFSWRGKNRCTRPVASDASSSPVDAISPPAGASTTSSASTEPLSQEQIQHNYQEFEQRKQKKAAERAYYAATIPGFDGIVSPTELEDKAFERIFIEDDEADDWMSEADGLSEEMGSVRMDV